MLAAVGTLAVRWLGLRVLLADSARPHPTVYRRMIHPAIRLIPQDSF